MKGWGRESVCLSLLAALALPTIFYESARLGEVRCAT